MAQATRMIRPLMMYCRLDETLINVRPTKIMRSSTTPMMTPRILPIPPTNETPPMTQAAMASSS